MVIAASAYAVSKLSCFSKDQVQDNYGYRKQNNNEKTARCAGGLQAVIVAELFIDIICFVGAILAMGAAAQGFLSLKTAQVLFGVALIDALLVIGISAYICPTLRQENGNLRPR